MKPTVLFMAALTVVFVVIGYVFADGYDACLQATSEGTCIITYR